LKVNKLTIHFHLSHFQSSGLPLVEYFLLLLYEQRQDWTVKELMLVLSQSDRTVTRMRVNLTARGYLKKLPRETVRPFFLLTDKLYKNG
jgi:hypothetical protein